MLEEMVEQKKVEVDADECSEPESRLWRNEIRFEVEDGDEIRTISVNDNTHLSLVN
jgi:hypothetical protein